MHRQGETGNALFLLHSPMSERHTHENKKTQAQDFFQKLLSITELLEFIILFLTSEKHVGLMPIQAEHSERFRGGLGTSFVPMRLRPRIFLVLKRETLSWWI